MAKYFCDPKLDDHVRYKKWLIAPGNRIKKDERFVLSSWIHTRLPEVLWIGELIEGMGVDDSLAALETIITVVVASHAGNEPGCPVLASYWLLHATRKTKSAVRKALSETEYLGRVSKALETLQRMYPEYPLGFMVQNTDDKVSAEDLEDFKERLSVLSNRFSVRAVRVHAHIMRAQLNSGVLGVPEGFSMPDFDVVYGTDVDPEGQEFCDAAGMIRACVGNVFAFFTLESKLVAGKYFWNHGLEIQDCERDWAYE